MIVGGREYVYAESSWPLNFELAALKFKLMLKADNKASQRRATTNDAIDVPYEEDTMHEDVGF